MAGIDRIQKRFDELAAMAVEVRESKTETRSQFESGVTCNVDPPLALKWATSVISLLHSVFGIDHPSTKAFENAPDWDYAGSLSAFDNRTAIFASAKEDFEGGYLFEVKNLVHASIFSDELAQAEHLLSEGWKTPAAVIAGVALETSLRELCTQHPDLEPKANANRMNQDLAGAGVYNRMRADQIQAWAKIRNHAAHGEPDEFDEDEVSRLIDGVRDFIAKHMT